MSTEEIPGGLRGRKRLRTRESLADAALALLLEHGLAGVSVEETAARVEVSRRTFSRYFASKEDAVLECVRVDYARINAAFAARPAAEEPVAAYCAALAQWLADPEHPAWHLRPGMPELFRLVNAEPTLTAVFRRLSVEAEEESIRIAAERLGLDPVTDLRPAVAVGTGVAVLMAATRAWVRLSRTPDGRAPGDRAAELPALVREATAVLMAEPSAGGPRTTERKDPS